MRQFLHFRRQWSINAIQQIVFFFVAVVASRHFIQAPHEVFINSSRSQSGFRHNEKENFSGRELTTIIFMITAIQLQGDKRNAMKEIMDNEMLCKRLCFELHQWVGLKGAQNNGRKAMTGMSKKDVETEKESGKTSLEILSRRMSQKC